MWFHSVADSVNFSHKVKLWSPMVARLQIAQKVADSGSQNRVMRHASNRNRKKLSHVPDLGLSATRLMEPIIRGKGYKARSQVARSKQRRGSSQKGEDGDAVEEIRLEDLDDRAIRKRKHKLDDAERYEN